MKDIDIRTALHNVELRRIVENQPDTMVIDELGIMEGKYRVDVATVNGILHGYEIKSETDTLDRLPSQQESFSKVFDKITLVADEKHVSKAVEIVPKWWGLIAVQAAQDGTAILQEIWPPRQNLSVDPFALAQLLWRGEVLQILASRGLASGIRHLPRKYLWKALADFVPLEELRQLVCQTLKNRQGWREPLPATASGKKPKRRRPRRAKSRKGARK